MNKLTITKKIAITAAVLGFAFSAHASNEITIPMNYQQALANLITTQGKQVMQDISTTVEQSINENLDEFNFLSTLAWAKATAEENLTISANIVAKTPKITEE